MVFKLGPSVPAVLDDRFPVPVCRPFTTNLATRTGVTPRTLARLVSHGLLRRVLKGVYVGAQVEDSMFVRTEALILVVPRSCVVTDRTAGWLHGGEVLAPNDHLRVPPLQIFRTAGNTRLRNALCASGQRTFLPEDLMEINGLIVTTPLRTAWDLGRLLRRDQAIGALDSMLRLGKFSKEEMLGGIERFRRQRGVVQLSDLAPLADARSESPGESTLRLRWLDASDLPRPEPQVPILSDAGREIYFLDLGVEEYDGELWHSRDEDRENDERRRGWIRDERDWVIRVFTKADVYGPHEDASRVLREGVSEARHRLGCLPWAPSGCGNSTGLRRQDAATRRLGGAGRVGPCRLRAGVGLRA
jgi:hypothetical protein